MVHCRGIPTLPTENEPVSVVAPLCSTPAIPARGRVTTAMHEVTCNECRKILKLPALADLEDESSKRYP